MLTVRFQVSSVDGLKCALGIFEFAFENLCSDIDLTFLELFSCVYRLRPDPRACMWQSRDFKSTQARLNSFC